MATLTTPLTATMAAVVQKDGKPLIRGKELDLDSARVVTERQGDKIVFVLHVDYKAEGVG